MNSLIIIRGPLGVGKTTVARKLAEQLRGDYVSIDDTLSDAGLDKAEEGGGIPVQNFVRANEMIIPTIKERLMSGRSVVVDGNFYHRAQLDHLCMAVEGRVFTLKAPVETCIQRDHDRVHAYGEDAARAVHAMVSAFDAGTVIDTESLDVDQVVARILESIA